jgi:hypothetical protein
LYESGGEIAHTSPSRAPLKLGCLNGHALCTYFIGKYGRLFKHSTLKYTFLYIGIQNFVTNPKLVRGLLRLQVSRAPPWYFPPINQSCLLPSLRPPITNPSSVKPPLSIQWTPVPQCCLPGSISSLLAPSPPQYRAACCKEGSLLRGGGGARRELIPPERQH